MTLLEQNLVSNIDSDNIQNNNVQNSDGSKDNKDNKDNKDSLHYPKIELILPAGNRECLYAAVENGADAVYFGVGKFNARQRAGNFSLVELKDVVNYCHNHGVKAYCTMNTLVKNNEIKDFFAILKEAYFAGVDAVIIQHLSFLPLIKSSFPGMEVHLSTQVGISNASFYELIKIADKVVLPREFSREEVEEFIQRTGLPVEIFVQGALCFSYSGKCLFSSFLGGRSGNRGWCAQPCRRRFNDFYPLSMKDLCLVYKIPEMIELGVSSLKVEGRLRSRRYVAAVAKLYRAAIDTYYQGSFKVDDDWFKEMELSFNREFTKGYFSGETKLVSPERPMGRGIFLGVMENGNEIVLENELRVGDGLGIWLQGAVDGALLRRMEKNKVPVKSALSGERVKLFIRAPVGTKIYLTSTTKEIKLAHFPSKPAIVTEKRVFHELKLPEIKTTEVKSYSASNLNTDEGEILVKVYSKREALDALRAGAQKVFYNIFATDFAINSEKAVNPQESSNTSTTNSNYGAYIPRILSNSDVEKAVQLIQQYKVQDILVGDLGAYTLLKNNPALHLYLDYAANIFNDYDVNFFQPAVAIISPELSFTEMQDFKNRNFAVFVNGRVVLMNTKYSELPKQLRDEKDYVFPVRREHDYYQILNSKVLGLFEEVMQLKRVGINRLFLDLERNAGSIVKLYKQLWSGKQVEVKKKGFTRGHWEDKVD